MAGEMNEIFNERGLVLGLLGMMGGAVRSAALKTTWREGLRVVFIGGTTAFGVGALAPYMLKPWIGDLPDDIASTLGVVGAACFVVGLMGVTLVERLLAGKPIGRENDDET